MSCVIFPSRTFFPLAKTFFLRTLANDLFSKSLVRPASASSWCVSCDLLQRHRSDVTKTQKSWFCTEKYPVCSSYDSFYREMNERYRGGPNMEKCLSFFCSQCFLEVIGGPPPSRRGGTPEKGVCHEGS